MRPCAIVFMELICFIREHFHSFKGPTYNLLKFNLVGLHNIYPRKVAFNLTFFERPDRDNSLRVNPSTPLELAIVIFRLRVLENLNRYRVISDKLTLYKFLNE